ncbi:gamma carbonic anhydrase family protein [Nocardioides acrostichi]|uniref:Gamma carbonic anhydrase family protein n=1 Tax=Nocardioides acrostichi TaxID=2784339 RepID=A0A930UZ85_9ACTN|nr:gamma carbonic anhydrase family protein [Nocardioides acrostichi]MBF4160755.1 gamma carbonic anhydrase family protein [Nocardioides acrostichi]
MTPRPLLLRYGGQAPTIADTAWIAPTATLIGAVTVRPDASVWFGAVIRADGSDITIGAGSNVQDGCVFHTDTGMPLTVGSGVAVGHNAVLHGCRIGDGVLVGMGAVVLNGARIGSGSLIAAGAVVLEGTEIPPRSLVAGVPATVRRVTTAHEVAMIADNASRYVARAREYASQ